jgi:hypothetical protein
MQSVECLKSKTRTFMLVRPRRQAANAHVETHYPLVLTAHETEILLDLTSTSLLPVQAGEEALLQRIGRCVLHCSHGRSGAANRCYLTARDAEILLSLVSTSLLPVREGEEALLQRIGDCLLRLAHGEGGTRRQYPAVCGNRFVI